MPTLPFDRILLRTLAEHVPQRIYAKDLQGRFLFGNMAVARGMGVAHPDELLGRTDADFYPPADAAQYRAEEDAIISSGQPMVNHEESVHYTRSGTDAWMLTTKVPLRDDDGTVIGIAGINQDITERKAAEAALREAKRVAEEATRAKSEFLAAMSHELRTPLNAVLGYTRLLQMDAGFDAEQKANLGTIEQSGQHLLLLVNDLLDFSRIETGRMELAPSDMHLPDLLQAVSSIVQVKAAEKRLPFASELDPDLPAIVWADGRRLSQVLLNLLGNAVKFTEAGQMVLRVRASQLQAGSARLRFEVHDTGAGMSLQEQARLFEPYGQAGGLAPRALGTGLGLAISRRLVEAMGGVLAVSSAPGVGSLFSFELQVPVRSRWCPALHAAGSAAGEALPLPQAEMQQLVTLARRGNMREISRFATHLSALGEPHRPVADTLQALASRCESRAILELAEDLARRVPTQR